MHRPALVRAAVIASIALAGAASPASALTININPNATHSANAAALAAFNRAADQWEARFTDNVTIEINAGLASLGAGILGQNSSVNLVNGYVDTFRPALVADAANEPSNAIVELLPATLNASNVSLPAGRSLTGNLIASKANLKALGFSAATLNAAAGTTNDATITFSTNFTFDFDNANGITTDAFDFESVASHEIGHALGFASRVDFIAGTTSSSAPSVELFTLDLFRFASNPGVAGFTTAPREMRPGSAAFTSDGVDAFAMSTGVGQQASHFLDGQGIGIMDPTLAPGELGVIKYSDLRALDLIGWDLNPAFVPEPTALAALGGALVVGLRRRRRI